MDFIYVCYAPDGGRTFDSGYNRNNPVNQQRLVEAASVLDGVHHVDLVGISYPGVYGRARTAASYYKPLVSGPPNTVRFIPGLWLHRTMEAEFGLDVFKDPSKNPSLMTTKRMRTALKDSFDRMAQGTQCDFVYVDGEAIFWNTRRNRFWSDDGNVAAVIDCLLGAALDANVELLLYHPHLVPAFPNTVRQSEAMIARLVELSNGGKNAEQQHTLLVPNPYYIWADPSVMTLPTIDELRQTYGVYGTYRYIFGAISDHASTATLRGYSPDAFARHAKTTETLVGIGSLGWYVTNAVGTVPRARIFADLPH